MHYFASVDNHQIVYNTNQSWVYSGVVPIPFQVYSRSGVDPMCSTPWSRVVEYIFRCLVNLLCSTTLLHGVEHLYSKILLWNGVERSSGVEEDPYTQYKTDVNEGCRVSSKSPSLARAVEAVMSKEMDET